MKTTFALIGMAILLIGCGNQPSFNPAEHPLSDFQKTVIHEEGKYYRVPLYAYGSTLDAKYAYINRVTSSGLLECKKDDSIVLHSSIKTENDKLSKNYYDSLTPEELITFRKHPTIIPKRDSKEFQAIIAYETRLVRDGKMTCVSPMSAQEVKEYKAYIAQQQKINNDPRVIAARAQQSAAMMQQMSNQQMQNEMAWQRIQQNNQMMQMQNQMTSMQMQQQSQNLYNQNQQMINNMQKPKPINVYVY